MFSERVQLEMQSDHCGRSAMPPGLDEHCMSRQHQWRFSTEVFRIATVTERHGEHEALRFNRVMFYRAPVPLGVEGTCMFLAEVAGRTIC